MTPVPDGATVLIVEEETHEREAILEHLAAAGYSAEGVESADEALALLDGRSFAALVTDAHLPGRVEGYELARIARERFPAMAVVMMSGHSDASSGPLPEGAAFVAKPYLLEHLVPTLRGRTSA